MDHCGTLCVDFCADGSQDSGNASADILSEQDRLDRILGGIAQRLFFPGKFGSYRKDNRILGLLTRLDVPEREERTPYQFAGRVVHIADDRINARIVERSGNRAGSRDFGGRGLTRFDLARTDVGQRVAHRAVEERVFHLGHVRTELEADLDHTGRRLGVRQCERIVVCLGTRKHDPLQTAAVGAVPPAGDREVHHDAGGREGNNTVLERTVEAGRLAHGGEVGIDLRSNFDLAVTSERHARRLVRDPHGIGVGGVDNDIGFGASLCGSVKEGPDQILRKGIHAVVTGFVGPLVNLHVDLGVGVGGIEQRRNDVVAPLTLGLAAFARQFVPLHAGHAEGEARGFFTIDGGVLLVLDIDLAFIRGTDFGLRELNAEGRLLLPVGKFDLRGNEDSLLTRRYGHGNYDRTLALQAAYGERHLGRSRGVEFLGTYILLRREIDAVTIGIFGFPGVEVLVVVTPHEEERRQEHI